MFSKFRFGKTSGRPLNAAAEVWYQEFEKKEQADRPLAPWIEAESLLFDRRYIRNVLGEEPAQEKYDRYVHEQLQYGIADQIPCLQL